MLHQLLTSAPPALLWQGNDGFLLWDGRHLIATDLDLTLSERLQPPTVSLDELAQRLDLLMITHGHGDHFNQATVQALLRHDSCQFLIPESCRAIACSMEGLEARSRFCQPGDRLDAPLPIECLRAVHGHIGGSIYSGASMLDCGYRFRFGGLTFYQPGDTVLLQEHLEMPPVDVLFVSPTEHNLGVDNAVRLIRMLRPGRVILQHHSTYHETPENRFWTHGYVQEVLEALTPQERLRCVVPEQGRVISLAGD